MSMPAATDIPNRAGGAADAVAVSALRVLILEDVPEDAELIQRMLRTGGLTVTAKRVDTQSAFAAALRQFAPHIVLVDFKLPTYDGLSAIELVHAKYPTLPVIVVTGVLGDEKAIELMKAGAVDYILKDRLARLPAAVKRALREAEQTRLLHRQEAALRTAQLNLHAVAYSQDPIIMMNEKMEITFWNKSAEAVLGYTAEEAIGRGIYSFLASGDESETVRREIDQFMRADRNNLIGWTHKLRIKKRDGSVFPVALSISFVRLEDRWNVIGVVRPHLAEG